MLEGSGLRVGGYGEGSRSYLFEIKIAGVRARVFREKDIPVQVALGNYDLGICSWAWVQELKSRFAAYPIIALRDLGFGITRLYAATSSEFQSLDDVASLSRVRIASEYPNVAERFARGARMRAFRVQSVAGAAEAYPPEDADLVLLSASDEANVREHSLNPLFEVLQSSAWLIANRDSVASKDLASVVRPLLDHAEGTVNASAIGVPVGVHSNGSDRVRPTRSSIRMAVPDGHQQRHASSALADAGIQLEGYDGSPPQRRPRCSVGGLAVKVIRPQDMPHLVATGELDIAITGRDCLREHLYTFPSSPVEEVVDLQRGQYNLCAVVSEAVKVDSIEDAMAMWQREGKPYLRIAAEYPATADHYARSRHIWRYRVIPIAGASEGFVPEDAELLIEGTETGRTLRENNLKPIDQIYRSTTCVIARKNPDLPKAHASVFNQVLSAFQKAGSQVDQSA
jgi:ATP phosphoribosyltransferase